MKKDDCKNDRLDPGLPDSEEDIWMQLLAAAQTEAVMQAEPTGADDRRKPDQVGKSGKDHFSAFNLPFSLPEIYQISGKAIEGGMGAVWKVHHSGWNVDLAMKRPKPEMPKLTFFASF